MSDRRERALCDGVETLHDQDLLAIVLGTGARGEPVGLVAAHLLENEGGLVGVARNSPHGLSNRRGIGPAKATRLAAAFELGRRVQISALGPTSFVSAITPRSSPGRTLACRRSSTKRSGCSRSTPAMPSKSARRIARGGAHGCALSTRDVLAPALRDNAHAIILIHNHPSGDPRPSPEDLAMTIAIRSACEVVGVPLLDHVVVARGGSSSLFEHTLV